MIGEESLIWNEVIVGVNFAICSTIPWRKGKVTQSLMWSGFLMKNLAKIFTGLTIQLIKLNCLPLVRISVDLVDCFICLWLTYNCTIQFAHYLSNGNFRYVRKSFKLLQKRLVSWHLLLKRPKSINLTSLSLVDAIADFTIRYNCYWSSIATTNVNVVSLKLQISLNLSINFILLNYSDASFMSTHDGDRNWASPHLEISFSEIDFWSIKSNQ